MHRVIPSNPVIQHIGSVFKRLMGDRSGRIWVNPMGDGYGGSV
jgi:hypothetical protein